MKFTHWSSQAVNFIYSSSLEYAELGHYKDKLKKNKTKKKTVWNSKNITKYDMHLQKAREYNSQR